MTCSDVSRSEVEWSLFASLIVIVRNGYWDIRPVAE